MDAGGDSSIHRRRAFCGPSAAYAAALPQPSRPLAIATDSAIGRMAATGASNGRIEIDGMVATRTGDHSQPTSGPGWHHHTGFIFTLSGNATRWLVAGFCRIEQRGNTRRGHKPRTHCRSKERIRKREGDQKPYTTCVRKVVACCWSKASNNIAAL
jgi:hypothetical protein